MDAVDARTAGRLSGVVVAVGSLGDSVRATADPRYAVASLQINFVSVVGVLTDMAELLAGRGSGLIIGSHPAPSTEAGSAIPMAPRTVVWLSGCRGCATVSGMQVYA